MPSHAESFDTQSKGKPGDFFGIVAHGRKDMGIDHSRSTKLDPVIVPAEVGLHTRLSEGEVVGTESQLRPFTKEQAREAIDGAQQIGQADVRADGAL